MFQATEASNKAGQNFLRDVDTEYKILNDLADKIGTNYEVKGSIKLFTEKETCDSCNLIIKQFNEKYPNVTI
ncbi:deaminase domain-containing protein [Lysinibacillus sphaericus]|uniref:deaminase domain-containing protein n=1 Tax=Lysinibacillus sphaericus TaxID=1421 RepID=UPI001EF26366